MMWTFFYGAWINLKILKEKDLSPSQYEVGRLHGYDIRIQHSAKLIPSERHLVYGVLIKTSKEKHQRIVSSLIQGAIGNIYLPEAVLVETLEGHWRPAICYIAASWEPSPLNLEYYAPFLKSAREWGFPEWYIKHLESFHKHT